MLTEAGAARSTLIESGSVVLANSGFSLGVAKILRIACCANDGVAAILDLNGLDARFLCYAINAQTNRLRKVVSRGNDQPNLNTEIIRSIVVPCPPLSEQVAIANSLSDADELIASLDALITKKRDLKQAAMQQLLTGKARLPGFEGEWKLERLGDCLSSSPKYGINAPAIAYSDQLPTYIRITDITERGRFSRESLVSVSSPFASEYLLEDGDLVFARTGASVGKSYLHQAIDGPLVFAGFLIRIRPDRTKLIPAFLSALVTMSRYWNWVRLMSMRSGQPGINGNEYRELPISLPSIDEQAAIASMLSDMDTELAVIEANREPLGHERWP